MVLSDEIYSRLLFEGEHYSILSVPGIAGAHHPAGRLFEDLCHDRMAHGLRRDAPDLAAHIDAPDDQLNSCTASFTQMAGIEALRGDQSFGGSHARRVPAAPGCFCGRAEQIKGFSCRVPKGAFYVFPNITRTGWKSKQLADVCWKMPE